MNRESFAECTSIILRHLILVLNVGIYNESSLSQMNCKSRSARSYNYMWELEKICFNIFETLDSRLYRRYTCNFELINLMSTPVFFLCFLTRKSMTRWSKSSPPRWLSPLVATTSNTPWSMVNRETSKVPPPKSNTNTDFSPPFLFNP